MASVESVYRRLLVTYPPEYRREHQAEILTTLVEAAEPGRRWPSLREAGGLLVGGLRTRALLAARHGGRTLLADGIRFAVVLLLGAQISNYTGFVGLLPPGYAPFVPLVTWIAALLLTLALVAAVRGATRSALVLVVLGGVASMPWSQYSRSIFGGAGSAAPTSPQTGVLILVAALLVGLTSMRRLQRPWSWWLAVAVIAGPMLLMNAHQWYFQHVLFRLDGAHYQYFYAALNFLDSLVSVAVPSALIALTMIARDPRPSIAAAVFAGAGLLSNLYASVTTGIEFHGYPWSLLPGFFAEPTLIIAVSAVTMLATIRGGQRLLPP